MKVKNVLLVGSKLYGSDKGGTQKVFHDLLIGLASRKELHLHILSERDGGSFSAGGNENVTFHLIEPVAGGAVRQFFSYQKAYYRVLKKINVDFDVIHFQNFPGGKFFAAVGLARKRAKKLILTVHDWPMLEKKYEPFFRKILLTVHWYLSLLCMRHFDTFIVFSEFNRRRLAKITNAKIHLLKIGFDEKTLIALSKNNLPKRSERILYFGAVIQKKGVSLLLRAIHGAGISLPVLIAGEGKEKTELQRFCRENHLENVRFLSWLPEPKKRRYLKESEIIVFPSEYEGYGIAILEALLSGNKVLTSDCGGQVDFKNDFPNLFLFKSMDAHDLSEKIKELKNMPTPKTPDNIKKYNNREIIRNYLRVYEA